MNGFVSAILNLLNQPVPEPMATHDTWTYFLVVLGGGTVFSTAWWGLCFIIRNGIDGSKVAMRALYRHDFKPLRKVLLNNWRVHGTAEGEVGPVDLREPEVGK